MARSTADAPWPVGLDRFQNAVGEWAEQTFTAATDASVVAHLRREVKELRDLMGMAEEGYAIATHEIALESADCFLLLLHLAHRCGFSLIDAAETKFAANKRREWGKPDAEGVVEHVR